MIFGFEEFASPGSFFLSLSRFQTEIINLKSICIGLDVCRCCCCLFIFGVHVFIAVRSLVMIRDLSVWLLSKRLLDIKSVLCAVHGTQMLWRSTLWYILYTSRNIKKKKLLHFLHLWAFVYAVVSLFCFLFFRRKETLWNLVPLFRIYSDFLLLFLLNNQFPKM